MKPARTMGDSTHALVRAGADVLVLYEPGRAGVATLDLARELVEHNSAKLTVLGVAPRAERGCCGSALTEYVRAVREAIAEELRDARKRLGPTGDHAVFKVLVDGSDPPLNEWIAAASVTLVLLPARRRVLRAVTHPAAAGLQRSTGAVIHVVSPPPKASPSLATGV